jgi:dTDP-4-amino-4,6-dideoxygalactose transaminase
LALKGEKRELVKLPSIIPPVVPNMIIAGGNYIDFYDDIDWVGDCYHLHNGVYDSAQEVHKNQMYWYKDSDLLIFSFYPTKPVGSCDGGMVVSNDKEKIDWFRAATMNGTAFSTESWGRAQIMPGYKFHANSLQMYMAQQNLRKLDQKNSIIDDIREEYNYHFGLNNISRHLYRIRVENNGEFVESMKKVGISCGIHYKCCHKYPFYNPYQQFIQISLEGRLPKSELEEMQTVSIPFHENLTTEEVRKVIEHVQRLANI